jgi:cytochrome P450
MLYIMTNPNVYRKLQAEIDLTVREGGVISDKQARTLPYLQAIIKEGSRICPPTTGILSKKAPPKGEYFKGRFIPGGVEIGQCSWGLQRSQQVYGEDIDLFRPERWLEAKGEDLERMERSLGLIWGYGKFSCLGKHIAFLELNKIFFEVRPARSLDSDYRIAFTLLT